MSCHRFRQRLGPHLEGDLGDAERLRIEAHLDDCADCRDELVALRRTVGLVRGLPDVDPPPHLAQRVIARVRDGEADANLWDRISHALGSPSLRAGAVGAVAGAILAAVLLQPATSDPRDEAAALRAALRGGPPPTPDLQLGPRFGAAAAPEPAGQALLETATLDAPAALGAWQQLSPEDREAFAIRLAERARESGASADLAAALRSLGADAADLAGRLEALQPEPGTDAF